MPNPSLVAPSGVDELLSIWSAFKERSEAYHEGIRELGARECLIRGLSDEQGYLAVFGEAAGSAAMVDMHKVSAGFHRVLVSMAARDFAPPGARLEINEGDLAENGSDPDSDKYDPGAAWDYLRSKYGGANGAEIAYRSSARLLVRHLGLRRDSPFKIVGGRTVVSVTVYLDSFDGSMGCQSGCSLVATIGAFRAVGIWSGLFDDGANKSLLSVLELLKSRRTSTRFAERHQIGEHVLVVPFKSKWEFRLSPAFAEQTAIFIAQFDGFPEGN